MNLPHIAVETTPDAPTCPVCGRQGILSARVPGEGTAVLCETCDIDDPDAGALIAYFAVHGSISAETFDQGSALVSVWLTTARIKAP